MPMTHHVLLLRGINLPKHKRIAMPALREALESAGFVDVRTYLQSGNVVLRSDAPAAQVAGTCQRRIEGVFGLDVDVLVRTRKDLEDVVRLDPLGEVVVEPRRYQVTFLMEPPDAAAVTRLEAATAESEELAVIGREIYTWHPNGIGRSRLAALLAGPRLGAIATSRNWVTVTSLLEMTDPRSGH